MNKLRLVVVKYLAEGPTDRKGWPGNPNVSDSKTTPSTVSSCISEMTTTVQIPTSDFFGKLDTLGIC